MKKQETKLKKIFIICGKHPLHKSGGYAAMAYILGKSLKTLGYEPEIITISSENKITASEIGKIHSVSSKFASFKSQGIQTAGFPIISYKFAKYIKKIVKDENIKKYITLGVGPWGLAGVILKDRGEKNLVINHYATTLRSENYWYMRGARIRDFGLWTKIKYTSEYLMVRLFLVPFEKKLFKYSDLFFVHYESTKKILMKESKIPAEKIKIIPYYTTLYSRKENIEQKDKESPKVIVDKRRPMCITICRQEPRKGINYLIRAYKILLEDYKYEINPVIIGSGDLLNREKKLAKKLGVDDKIKFLGFVENTVPYLKNADIYAFAPLYEGSGSISILEAMKYGLPIVTSDCDGIPEDIEDGVSGLIVPKEDEHSLAEAIKSLLDNKSMAFSLGENAAKTYNDKFSMDSMAIGLEGLFSDYFE